MRTRPVSQDPVWLSSASFGALPCRPRSDAGTILVTGAVTFTRVWQSAANRWAAPAFVAASMKRRRREGVCARDSVLDHLDPVGRGARRGDRLSRIAAAGPLRKLAEWDQPDAHQNRALPGQHRFLSHPAGAVG